MDLFERGAAIVGLVGAIGGGVLFMENRYASGDEVAKISNKASAYYKMNAAQIQQHIVEKDLEMLIKKPADMKDDWDKFKEAQLKQDLLYWSEAVKKADEEIKN